MREFRICNNRIPTGIRRWHNMVQSNRLTCNVYELIVNSILFYRVMVFNATSNNISVISWQSVLFAEETGDNHRPRPVANHWYRVYLTMSGLELTTLMVIGTD